MIVVAKQKQSRMPISIVMNSTSKHGGYVITVGESPRKVKTFFVTVHGIEFQKYRISVNYPGVCTQGFLIVALKKRGAQATQQEYVQLLKTHKQKATVHGFNFRYDNGYKM